MWTLRRGSDHAEAQMRAASAGHELVITIKRQETVTHYSDGAFDALVRKAQASRIGGHPTSPARSRTRT
jgi:hypothetical protein